MSTVKLVQTPASITDIDVEKDHHHNRHHGSIFNYEYKQLIEAWKEVAGVFLLLVVHLVLGFLADFSNHSRTKHILTSME